MKIAAQALDMPPPWSPKIYIEKDRFIAGTPLGESTTFYIKTKVEKYADYSQTDGLVLKYTLYEVTHSRFRTSKNSESKNTAISTNTEAINSKEDTDIPMNSRQFNTTVLANCPIGSNSSKSIAACES